MLGVWWYVAEMMQRTNIYLDKAQVKILKKFGGSKGLKVAQVIRLAISQFIEKEVSKK